MTSPDTDTGMLHDREPYDPPVGTPTPAPMTTTRQIIAYAIDPLAWCEYGDRRIREHTLKQADAVIAALGDRLAAERAPVIRESVAEHVRKITETVEYIRGQEIRPGTTVRTETTLATCPADMDRIMRSVRALEAAATGDGDR